MNKEHFANASISNIEEYINFYLMYKIIIVTLINVY